MRITHANGYSVGIFTNYSELEKLAVIIFMFLEEHLLKEIVSVYLIPYSSELPIKRLLRFTLYRIVPKLNNLFIL